MQTPVLKDHDNTPLTSEPSVRTGSCDFGYHPAYLGVSYQPVALRSAPLFVQRIPASRCA